MIKKIIFVLLVIIPLLSKAQNTSFSGNLHCKINGASWSGNVSGAIYDKTEDYLSIVFESDDHSQIQITLKPLRREYSTHIPYVDMYQVQWPIKEKADVEFWVTYVPDKNIPDKKYEELNSQLAINALDLNLQSIQADFIATCFTGYLGADFAFHETGRVEITDASTSEVKYIQY